MITAKDGRVGPTRIVLRSKEHFKGELLVECNQIIREPVNMGDLLTCLGEEQEISRVLITNVPVSRENIDGIIKFFEDIKTRLV